MGAGAPTALWACPPALVGVLFRLLRNRKTGRIAFGDYLRPPLIGARSPVASLRGPFSSPPCFVFAHFRLLRSRKCGRIASGDYLRPPLIGARSPVASLRGPLSSPPCFVFAHFRLLRSRTCGRIASGDYMRPPLIGARSPVASLRFFSASLGNGWADQMRRFCPPVAYRGVFSGRFEAACPLIWRHCARTWLRSMP